MSSSSTVIPKRGEIWLVDFNPTIGSEMSKRRPALVISSDGVGKLPLKIVAPLTNWQNSFATNYWHIRIDPTALNGLDQIDAIDAFQIRSVSLNRFIRKIGIATSDTLEEVAAALAAIVEYQ